MAQANRLNGEAKPKLDGKSAEPDNRPRHLLIVDDNELTCRQLQKLLQTDSSYKVDFLTDANQALKALSNATYSIILTDLYMPKLGGMDLIRLIHERRLPVTIIVTTGHGSITEAVEAIRLGAYDFLTKPVDVDHLRLVKGVSQGAQILESRANVGAQSPSRIG